MIRQDAAVPHDFPVSCDFSPGFFSFRRRRTTLTGSRPGRISALSSGLQRCLHVHWLHRRFGGHVPRSGSEYQHVGHPVVHHYLPWKWICSNGRSGFSERLKGIKRKRKRKHARRHGEKKRWRNQRLRGSCWWAIRWMRTWKCSPTMSRKRWASPSMYVPFSRQI